MSGSLNRGGPTKDDHRVKPSPPLQAEPAVSVSAWERHVVALCHHHDITREVRRHPPGGASSDPERRRIYAPPVTDLRSYYTTLHEIAHVILGYDFTAAMSPQEAEAWRWAIGEAVERPSEQLRHHIFARIWRYVLADAHAGTQRADLDRFAPPGAPLWEFLASLDDETSRLLYEVARFAARGEPPRVGGRI